MGRPLPTPVSTETEARARTAETTLAHLVQQAVTGLRSELAARPRDEGDGSAPAADAVAAALDEHLAAVVRDADPHLVEDIAARPDVAPPEGLPATGLAPVINPDIIKYFSVGLDGLEVTQEVQDLGHSVPLVAGKPAVVRAYLRYRPGPVQVRGELLVARSPAGPWTTVPSLAPAELDPSRSGSTPAELRARRAETRFSLNFRLPAALTAQGPVWLRMGAVRRLNGTPLPSLAGLTARTVTFRRGTTLRLRLVLVRYQLGTPPVTYLPSATDVALIASWLRRAYPISALSLTTVTVNAPAAAPFQAFQVNAQLAAIRAVDVSTGTDARTHYYGLVNADGFFMRGFAAGIPSTPAPQTVASGPAAAAGFPWDTDGSYGDWYTAHELAHTLGRFHAEFCGAAGGAPYPFPGGQLSGPDEALTGLDVGDNAVGIPMRALVGTTTHDVMTYCDNQWLSSFTYGGIYDRLVAEDALPAGAVPAGSGIAGERDATVRLVAAVNLTSGRGDITTVWPVPAVVASAAPAAESQAEDADRVTVRLLDAAGNVLAEFPVPFVRSACAEPGDDVTGIVDADVPRTEGATTVQLLLDGQLLDSYPIGGEAVEPAAAPAEATAEAGAAPDGSAGLHLQWQVEGAPESQRYAVQIGTADGGWQTLAVGLREPSVVVDPADLGAGRRIAVRLLASTGTGTTVVREEEIDLS